MTALVFPPSPVIDEQFPDPSVPGVPVWVWDGQKWNMAAGECECTTAVDGISIVGNGTAGGPLEVDEVDGGDF